MIFLCTRVHGNNKYGLLTALKQGISSIFLSSNALFSLEFAELKDPGQAIALIIIQEN